MNPLIIDERTPEPQNKLAKKEGINLVLSGGGVKGVAHIALIELLQAYRVKINAISGTSAGALVGAMYASGLSTAEMLDFFKSTPLFRYTWLTPTKAGIFDSDKYAPIISQYIKDEFEQLSLPLSITAVDMEAGKPVYFTEGNLIRPLLASCAVPAVFSPVNIEGRLYSDGGIMDNFPVHPFLKCESPMLGSYICKPSIKEKKELNSILKVTNHSNALLIYAGDRQKFHQTTETIEFPIGQFGLFDTKRIDEIYAEAKAFLQGKRFLMDGQIPS